MYKSTYASSYKPAAGTKIDFEKLLAKFTEKGSVRFEEFSAIWRDMKMSLIFAGRQDDQECREFTEEMLRIAVDFWMPPYSFQTRIGALYLLYGLYSKQLFKLKAKIRVTLSQWREALMFLGEIQQQQHLDVEYIFQKLRDIKAFHFVAAVKQLYPLMSSDATYDKVTETPGGRTRNLIEREVDLLQDIFQSDTHDQLSVIHSEYQRLKCELAGPAAKRPNSGLDLITADFPETMDKLLNTFEDWKKAKRTGRRRKRKDSTDLEPESDSKQPMAYKQCIKERAFQNITVARRSRRHRQVAIAENECGASPKKQGRRDHNKIATSESEGGEDVTTMDTPTTSTSLPVAESTGEFLSMPTFSESTEMNSTDSIPQKQSRAKRPKKRGSGKGQRKKKSAKVPAKAAKRDL